MSSFLSKTGFPPSLEDLTSNVSGSERFRWPEQRAQEEHCHSHIQTMLFVLFHFLWGAQSCPPPLSCGSPKAVLEILWSSILRQRGAQCCFFSENFESNSFPGSLLSPLKICPANRHLSSWNYPFSPHLLFLVTPPAPTTCPEAVESPDREGGSHLLWKWIAFLKLASSVGKCSILDSRTIAPDFQA